MPLVKPSLPPRPSSASQQQEGQLPKLAPCPRSTFTTAQDDWFQITIPDSFSNVDICSSCYNTTFRDTKYAQCMTKAGLKAEGMATKCDLSDRWNRAATFWLYSQNKPDLGLLGRVATLPPDEDGACPNLHGEDPLTQKGGKPAVTRTWYCIYDPATMSLVEDLTVCSACVARIDTLFPNLKGTFRPVSGGAKVQATCDFLTAQNENDGRRGEYYLDRFMDAEKQVLKTGTRDVRPIINYIRKWASIPVCVKSDHVPQGATSYTFPTSIPNYAACEECYTQHILPLLESTSPPTILKEMCATVSPTGFVCDLYSPRLQQWFKEACASYNLNAYKQKLTEREAKMQEFNLKLEQLKLQYQQFDRQAQMYRMQMQTAQNMERVRALQFSTSAYYAPPLDFSRSNVAMNQSHEAMLQAEMVQENYNLVKKEWAELYE